MRLLVTGGAGFIGSNLCLALLRADPTNIIYCLDNLSSGDIGNLRTCLAEFKNRLFYLSADVNTVAPGQLHHLVDNMPLDRIYHLACPASPIQYQKNPITTLKTNFIGTMNILEYAREFGGRVLLSSTSEIYGDAQISPQTEEYWGNVNPIGPRACYDEGKRIAETLMIEYQRAYQVDIRIVRIFNTYGPNMAFNDGRVVSNFIWQTLNGEKITLYGGGEQTRSFCYVDDLVRGLQLFMEQTVTYGPVNLGNPTELTMKELALYVLTLCQSSAADRLVYCPLPQDDPKQRRPEISRIQSLGWMPLVPLEEGLKRTIEYFRTILATKIVI